MAGPSLDASTTASRSDFGDVVVCLTGASGTVYGRRLAAVLSMHCGGTVHVVASDAAVRVMAAEEGVEWRPDAPLEQLFAGVGPFEAARIRIHGLDPAGPLASGSVSWRAAAVVPCSMATLGAVAAGAGRHLVHRICDVAMKEGRRLVVAPRETSLSAIHLENMARLAGLGVAVVPCMPGFYHRPGSVMDLVDFVVDRVATRMGCPVGLVPPWGG